jgi:predicted HTH transcriptional regulator
MSLFETINTMRLVRTGPSLKERIGRRIAAAHHRTVLNKLRRFREELEREMEPVSWTELEAPMVTLVADVCDALALTEEERADILGQEGERALTEFLASRPIPRFRLSRNERQDKAMAYAQEKGEINLSAYRELCPFWSDETLRLDLANLVKRKVLTKNGDRRGTVYKLAA